jgi:KUP system potassium uptake protein
MESIVQPAALRRQDVRLLPAAAALTALGVVYGDIGTSALYGFKQAADAAGTISPTRRAGQSNH